MSVDVCGSCMFLSYYKRPIFKCLKVDVGLTDMNKTLGDVLKISFTYIVFVLASSAHLWK